MTEKSDNSLANAARLLTVKKERGLAAKPPPAAEAEETDSHVAIKCVSCGYSQQGQAIDRCPECGLPLASQLRDTTPWTTPSPRLLAWWETARRVCLWDRRMRLRTSFLPTTAESWSFAKWSIGLSAAVLGLAIATFYRDIRLPGLLAAGYFTMQSAVGAVLTALVLWAGVQALTIAVRGTWRRRLSFVPASIHYSTAWWPPLAVLVLMAALLRPVLHQSEADVLLLLVVLLILPTWGLWLWGSITESQHVDYVAARVGIVVLCLAIVGVRMALFVPGAGRTLVISLLDRSGHSLAKLNAFGTYSNNPTAKGSQTSILFIDEIAYRDDYAIKEAFEKLGAENWVCMSKKQCTLDQIKNALRTARNELRPDDRFILYVRGHGSPFGSGAIQMADGCLTSQMLSDELVKLQTSHCLVVIDSCFGGKFLTALETSSCSAMVVTATDKWNVAYGSGLQPFWMALEDPKSDANGDGRITVEEAFWSAFPDMLVGGEKARRRDLAVAREPGMLQILAQQGFATPQFGILGKANRGDFAIRLPDKGADKPPRLEQEQGGR